MSLMLQKNSPFDISQPQSINCLIGWGFYKNILLKLILFTIFLLTLSGCSIIVFNGIFGDSTSYYSDAVELCGNHLCTLEETNQAKNCKQLVLNGLELKSIIKNQTKALVYQWSPRCNSRYCPPIESLKSQCIAKGIVLFVVTDYYDCNLFSDVTTLLYGIDVKYYNTDFRSKYIDKFLFDLTGIKGLESDGSRLYLFENGEYVYPIADLGSIGK